jgi:hypothetical protein
LRGEDEHVWIVFSRERVRTVRRAVARFPSVVVGEVVEAIITAQTNGVDAFVTLKSEEKCWLQLKLLPETALETAANIFAAIYPLKHILGWKTSLSTTSSKQNTQQNQPH